MNGQRRGTDGRHKVADLVLNILHTHISKREKQTQFHANSFCLNMDSVLQSPDVVSILLETLHSTLALHLVRLCPSHEYTTIITKYLLADLLQQLTMASGKGLRSTYIKWNE